MNQRLKLIGKAVIVVITTMIIIFGTSGCGNRGYKGDYPELFTIAMNSLLGVTGALPNMVDDPRITVLEKDYYERILFIYDEGGLIGASILISQKSEGGYVYFYPHYNFINFETFAEMTFWGGHGEFGMDHLYPETIMKIDELKERNHWNQELNLENSVKKEINIERFPQGPISRERLEEAFGIAWDYNGEGSPLRGTFTFLTTDEYGRSVYLGYRRESEEESGEQDWRLRPVRNIVMLFQPDYSFDETRGFLELEDLIHYQTILKAFKELNGWNQPFEGSTSMPPWWLVTSAVVIVGVGGFVGTRLYIGRGEVGAKRWLHLREGESIGQFLIALGRKSIYTFKSDMRRFLSLYTLGRGRRRIFSLFYIIMPSVLVNVLFLSHFVFPLFFVIPFWHSILILYLATCVGVILFFSFKPCEFNVLILGLFLSPLFLFIYAVVKMIPEITNAYASAVFILPFFILIATMPTLLYSLPFIAICFFIKRFNKMD